MKSRLATAFEQAWYGDKRWSLALLPLSWLVSLYARCRLARFRRRAMLPPVPVLVVGNITVGGTGKTPLVIALSQYFSRKGIRVAIISRGYRADARQCPRQVLPGDLAQEVGDEPLMMARRAGVPVIIDPRRARALQYAVEHCGAKLVISDDGLQHYALPRSAEIIVLDGARMLGNGLCLPSGPLREPASRLAEVNWRVVNGRPEGRLPDATVMSLAMADPVNVQSGESMPMEDFVARYPYVQAIAGIGNPDRFFSALRAQGLVLDGHAFDDHHVFDHGDLAPFADATLVMTEKDAVKCVGLVGENAWFFPVTAQLPAVFFESVQMTLQRGRK